MDIESALVAHLLADSKLNALVGKKIFPYELPQEDSTIFPDGVTPAIVYQRVSSSRTLTLEGEASSAPRFQFSVYAYDALVAREIARVLNQSLDFFLGELDGKVKAQSIRADYRDTKEHETGLYRSDVDFFILQIKNKE